MRKSLKRIVSGLTAIATVSSMLLTVAPVHAAQPTLMKDTMSRQEINALSTHSVSMTLPAGGILSTQTMSLTWSGFSGFYGTLVTTCGAGTASATGTAANALTVTGSSDCTGTLTITGINMVNPATTGSKAVTIGGTSSVSGGFAVPIVDSDQVTVTASVSASITFDIDTDVTHNEIAAPYSVALGTLTTGAVSGSNGTTVNSIFFDLSTNANTGAVVTVSSTNASLKSTSVPADTIASANATMTAGTANYGLCVINGSGSAGGGTIQPVAPFDDVSCDTTPAANVVGGVTVAPQNIVNTNSLPVDAGVIEVAVDAAISGTTPAHTDYTDTLKFIATGTF